MKTKMKAAVCAGLALLAACATTPPAFKTPPDWVSGAAAHYPASAYLLGRGAAATPNAAIDRARADLAKGLEVEIKVESSDVQTYALNQEAGKSAAPDEHMTLEITRNIASRTDRIVRGVQIAETWRDPADGTQHALAVLPRASAMQALQGDVRALDDATAAEIQHARAASDPFTAIAAADRALRDQAERGTVQRMLQVVDPSGQGIPERWSYTQLRNDRSDLVARVRIRPEAAGDETQEVATALAGALGEAGFNVVQEGAADYKLAAVLELQDLGRQEGWYWVTGSLEIVLGDSAGQGRGSHRWVIKASGQDPVLARRRALDQVETTLDRELFSTLLSFSSSN
jgi:hypothetical protein